MKYNEIRKQIIEGYLNRWVRSNYTNCSSWNWNDDGTVDVQGSVVIHDYNNSKLPVKFRNVSEDFYILDDRITSLEGCPDYVDKVFKVSSSSIKNLKYSPKSVETYNIDCNSLESIEGISSEIRDHLRYTASKNMSDITKDMLIEQGCKLKGGIILSTSGMGYSAMYGSSGMPGTSGPGPCPVGKQGPPGPQGVRNTPGTPNSAVQNSISGATFTLPEANSIYQNVISPTPLGHYANALDFEELYKDKKKQIRKNIYKKIKKLFIFKRRKDKKVF